MKNGAKKYIKQETMRAFLPRILAPIWGAGRLLPVRESGYFEKA